MLNNKKMKKFKKSLTKLHPKKYWRIISFALPVLMGVLTYLSPDLFLAGLTLVSLIFAIIFTIPSLLAGKSFSLDRQKHNQALVNLKNSSLKKTQQTLKKIKKTDLTNKLTRKKNQTKKQLLAAIALIAVAFFSLTAWFSYQTIWQLTTTNPQTNLLLSYYQAHSQQLQHRWSDTALLITILTIILVIGLNKTTKNNNKAQLNKLQTLLASITIVLITGTLAFHTALAIALGSAVAELQVLAQTIKTDPQAAGIYQGQDQVRDQLEKREQMPQLVRAADQLDQEIVKINFANRDHKSQFYNQTIISQVPAQLWPEIQLPEANLILFGNNLVIKEIREEEIEHISPTLGRLLVKNYFARSIKNTPNFDAIGRQDYLKYRDQQINDQLAEIDADIQAINSKIAGIRSSMTNLVYQYIRGEISFDQALNRYRSYQNQISSLNSEKASLRQMKEIVAAQKDRAPYELGIFLPDEDNAIKVVIDLIKGNSIDEYLATLVHEYLHYTSYVDEERRLPLFFEEGLTEYFARRVMKQELDVDTQVGYRLIVKIIEQMAQDIPEEELAEVYFTKNKNKLIELLDEAYGHDFYADSEYHFVMIFFSGKEEALKLANDLMHEIGGAEIKMADIDPDYQQ
ncbi:MAG: hypothetical protein GF390_01410 [Candidatus Pacebacteria bacterium]|nr:hypothetical protein [Candidatus Paceibacterota bacterium]